MTERQRHLLRLMADPASKHRDLYTADRAAILAALDERAELLAACELALGFFFDSSLDSSWLADQIRAAVEHAKGMQ